jgi:hypothetical protein
MPPKVIPRFSADADLQGSLRHESSSLLSGSAFFDLHWGTTGRHLLGNSRRTNRLVGIYAPTQCFPKDVTCRCPPTAWVCAIISQHCLLRTNFRSRTSPLGGPGNPDHIFRNHVESTALTATFPSCKHSLHEPRLDLVCVDALRDLKRALERAERKRSYAPSRIRRVNSWTPQSSRCGMMRRTSWFIETAAAIGCEPASTIADQWSYRRSNSHSGKIPELLPPIVNQRG